MFTIASWTGLVAARPAQPDHLARDADAKVTFGSKDSTTLTSDGKSPAILVLDYDYNVEGFPTFEVVSVKGDTSMFQITYAESRAALHTFMVRNLSNLHSPAGEPISSRLTSFI